MTLEELAKRIDHTILKPDATDTDIFKVVDEALRYGFRAVCVNGSYVQLVADKLEGTGILTCSVVGFPLGAMSTEAKAYETQKAVDDGADEIDMVMHIGRFKSGFYSYVLSDIEAVVKAAGRKHVKVIIETAYLTDEEKLKAVELIHKAGAHFVKTSTGFGPAGASVHDVKLLAQKAHPLGLKVKAAGGIRDYKTALEMIEAGADVIGASKSVKIIGSAK